jgi:predicted nucleic acid-binding Zn ribbon protein
VGDRGGAPGFLVDAVGRTRLKLEDLPDEDDWCAWCGGELPLDSLYGRRRFCSPACQREWHRDQERQAIEAARSGRTCDQCGGAIPTHLNLHARFCCHRCKVQWWSDRGGRLLRANRGDRPCQGCGRQIPPDRQANARYCSARCRARTWMRAKRIRDPDTGRAAQAERVERIKCERRAAKAGRTCEVCQAPLPVEKRGDAVTCSRQCKERRRTLQRRRCRHGGDTAISGSG